MNSLVDSPCRRWWLLALAVSLARAETGERAWVEHGFSAAQREALREPWTWGIAQHFVPGGSMLILHRGEIIFREAFGVADRKTRVPFAVDAPCRIASVTKPHTATLFALLVEQGRLGWEDPVDRHLPQFRGVRVDGRGPAARAPLLRELLSHTAGFPGQRLRGEERWKIRSNGTLADAVDDLARVGLAAEPGTRYAYTGLGYLVAGRVAEVVTGREFGALMREMLLVPIGAGGAVFLPMASAAVKARLPTMYERVEGALVRADLSGREESGVAFPNPGGGLVATVDDIARLMLLHRNGGMVDGRRVVAAESLRALYRPQPVTGREGYGLGFNVLRTDAAGVGNRLRHNGASGTLAFIDLQQDLIVVVLTQVPTKQRLPFGDRLGRALDSVFGGP